MWTLLPMLRSAEENVAEAVATPGAEGVVTFAEPNILWVRGLALEYRAK